MKKPFPPPAPGKGKPAPGKPFQRPGQKRGR